MEKKRKNCTKKPYPRILKPKAIRRPRGRFLQNVNSIGSAVSEVNLHIQKKRQRSYYFVYLDGYIG